VNIIYLVIFLLIVFTVKELEPLRYVIAAFGLVLIVSISLPFIFYISLNFEKIGEDLRIYLKRKIKPSYMIYLESHINSYKLYFKFISYAVPIYILTAITYAIQKPNETNIITITLSMLFSAALIFIFKTIIPNILYSPNQKQSLEYLLYGIFGGAYYTVISDLKTSPLSKFNEFILQMGLYGLFLYILFIVFLIAFDGLIVNLCKIGLSYLKNKKEKGE